MTRKEEAFNNGLDGGEYVCFTCLDRARLGLVASGQVHCAMVMKGLQERFDTIGEYMDISPDKPCEILDEMYEAMLTWNIFYDEDGEKRDA